MSRSCPRRRRCKFFTGHVEVVDHKGRGRAGLPATAPSKRGEVVSLIHSTSIPRSFSLSIMSCVCPFSQLQNDGGVDLVKNVASIRSRLIRGNQVGKSRDELAHCKISLPDFRLSSQ